MITPSVAIAFSNLLLDALKWLSDFKSDKDDKNKNFSARILYETGVSTLCIRALDSENRRLISRLIKFEPATTKHQREMIFDEINEYVQEKRIVNQLRETSATLTEYYQSIDQFRKPFRDKISYPMFRVRNLSLSTVDAVDGNTYEPDFFGDDVLADFWRMLIDANTESQVNSIIAFVKRRFGQMDFQTASISAELYGEIKGVILTEYPEITDPDWVFKTL